MTWSVPRRTEGGEIENDANHKTRSTFSIDKVEIESWKH